MKLTIATKKSLNNMLVLLSLLVAAFGKQPDDNELSVYFAENKPAFTQLAQAACAGQQAHQIIHHVFPPNSGTPSEYPELDNQLKTIIKGDFLQYIVIQGPICRLQIGVWGVGAFGEGQIIGYQFNPDKIMPYEPMSDIGKMKSEGLPVYYTNNLGDGWYSFYEYTP